MTARECLQILRKIKDVAFATADENGMPHNRIIDVMLVEDEKLYFCTARGKEFYRQLMGTEYTEITGMNGTKKTEKKTSDISGIRKHKGGYAYGKCASAVFSHDSDEKGNSRRNLRK